MLVYSQQIIQFVSEIQGFVKDILSREARLKVFGERFYNASQTVSYPIKIVVFTNEIMLGYFDPHFFELGFAECLMGASKKRVQDVIRHELAHYITFIQYGKTATPHSYEFKDICQRMGWGKEVYEANQNIEIIKENFLSEKSCIFRKVQKLLALASSKNVHEAELAMMKSREILLKHNIESSFIQAIDEEKIFLKRIMKQKRLNARMKAIGRILQTFFVNVVYVRSKEYIHLEILGSAAHIEIAEYVAGVLEHELDVLWNQARKQSQLKGALAKNSFFFGLAKGYCDKVEALKNEYSEKVAHSLIVLEQKLIHAKEMIYPRLCATKSNRSYSLQASLLGEHMGKQLTIHSSLTRDPKNFKGPLELTCSI